MYKIVDTFNGWEDEQRFCSYERAEQTMETYAKQFARNNPGAYPSFAIVTEDATWRWHYVRNQYAWI